MPEKIINSGTTVTADSGAYNAVDLDIQKSSTTTETITGQGSAVSIGDGILLTAAHNFIDYDKGSNRLEEADSISAEVREGLRNAGSDRRDGSVGDANRHNIGEYDRSADQINDAKDDGRPSPITNTGEEDFAVLTTDIKNSPTASMVVFQNPNDAGGTVRSFGYPGTGSINGTNLAGETLVETAGTLSANSFRDGLDSQYLRTNADSSASVDDGMGAVGGHSGGGVWLDQTLKSGDTRLEDVDLENKLAGTMTYGSKGPNPDFNSAKPEDPKTNPKNAVSYDAEISGASFTPITEELYSGDRDAAGNVTGQGIGQIADDVSREKHIKETYDAGKDARKDEVRAEGDRWDRDAKDAFKDEIRNDADIDEKIADRFDENILVADQQGADGSSSTFNGTIFNETLYTNQNVNVNIDLARGYDTADYFVLSKGIDAVIGANNVQVTKTFETVENGADGITPVTTATTAVDNIKNAEAIVGTGSDDKFLIKDFAGIEAIDGRDLPRNADGTAAVENDSLRIDSSVGPVTWKFDQNADGTINRESGFVIQGDGDNAKEVRFDNIENVGIRADDATNDPADAARAISPAGQKAEASEIVPATSEVQLNDAIQMLADDQRTLNRQAEETGISTKVHEAINHPDAVQMMGNLHSAGVESINVELTPDISTEDRVGAVLMAGKAATHEAGLLMPSEQRVLEAQAEVSAEQRLEPAYEAAYEDDYGYA